MCLIAFAYKVHPDFPLVLVANRDEFYARATQTAHFWIEHPDVFAGRDLDAAERGTWMGINRSGRFAAVTNFREMDFNEAVCKHSRGELTAHFLSANTAAIEYIQNVQQHADHYKGFNLLLWEKEKLFYVSNRIQADTLLTPGIYGLSNGALDSAWPKVQQAKAQLATQLQHCFNAETLLTLLMDRRQAADQQLPNTGIDMASERLLSSCFIHSDSYGTRASTVLLMHKNGGITFLEQNWNAAGLAEERQWLEIDGD